MFNSLRLLALVTGCANLAAEALHHQPAIYVTKPLTTTLLVCVALAAHPPVSSPYRALVSAGLAFSVAGDVFLMLPGDYFVFGLVCFLVAHVFYATAFALARNSGFGLQYAIPFAVYGIVSLTYLWPRLAMLELPVVVYVAVILIMGWQAVATWAATRRPNALVAAAGAVAFIASDSLLALDRFRGHFSGAHIAVMATYYVAQWLIASSVREWDVERLPATARS